METHAAISAQDKNTNSSLLCVKLEFGTLTCLLSCLLEVKLFLDAASVSLAFSFTELCDPLVGSFLSRIDGLLGRLRELCALLAEEFLAVFLAVLLRFLRAQTLNGSVRVEVVHEACVRERVFLASYETLVGLGRVDDALHLVRVDDARDVRVSQARAVEGVALLLDTGVAVGAEDAVELLESGSSPDDEAPELAARGELQEVQAVHVERVNAGDVAEGLCGRGVLAAEDDERALLVLVAAVAQLALTGADLLSEDDATHIVVSAKLLQNSDCLLCLSDLLEGVVNDERQLRH